MSNELLGQAINNIIKKYGKYIVAIALCFTNLTVNSTCPFVTFQPKIPENAEKLRKYK